MNHSALVLEGGGMRGVFTAGVLDYLLDNKIYYPYVVGVSAGALNALSYLSKQRGRAHQCNIEMFEKYRYIGIRQLLTKGCIMDFDLMFKDFPERLLPYDYDTYYSSSTLFEMVTCNCLTGKAMYLSEKKDTQRLLTIARASCSLPFLCPEVELDGIPMLDGGISDAIPVVHAMEKGYSKQVIVLTRNVEYRKSEKDVYIPSLIYKKYPNLREQLKKRAKEYNETLDLIESLEAEGKVIVIRPQKPIVVSRLEQDIAKLEDLYQEGYQCAADKLSGTF